MNLGFARLRFYAVGLVHLGLLEAGPCGAGDRTIDGGIDWGIDLVQRRLVGVLRLGDCRDVLRRGSRRSVRTAAVAVLVTPTAVAAAATVPTRLVVALVLRWDRLMVHDEPATLAVLTVLAERFQQPGAYALAGHLHQTERGDLGYLVARTVATQTFDHPAQDQVPVALQHHVDEVNDDDASDVAQPELTDDLLRGLEVVPGHRLLEVAP